MQWIDFSSHFTEIETFANQILSAKKGYGSFRGWTKNPSLPGLCGEKVFSIHAGCSMNMEFLTGGDYGYDFICGGGTIDVKASTRTDGSAMLLHPADSRRWADIFVLVILDMDWKEGVAIGYVSKEELQDSPIVNFGYIDDRARTISQLRPIEELFEKYKGTFKESGVKEAPQPKKAVVVSKPVDLAAQILEMPKAYDFKSFANHWSSMPSLLSGRLFKDAPKYIKGGVPVKFDDEKIVIEFYSEWRLAKALDAFSRIPFEETINRVLDKPRKIHLVLGEEW